MIVVLSSTAAAAISREAPASVDGRETGGVLLGHDTGGRLVVTVAGGPGTGADRRVDGFVRDLAHAQRLGDDAYDRDSSVWIGEWHTHPKGPRELSAIDMATYRRLLDDDELGFERVVSLIVTPCAVHGWSETHVTAWVVDGDGAHSVPIVHDDITEPPREGKP